MYICLTTVTVFLSYVCDLVFSMDGIAYKLTCVLVLIVLVIILVIIMVSLLICVSSIARTF